MSESNTETYSVAKGGIDALTHSLAITYGQEIRVNAIHPGWIDTRDDRQQNPLPMPAHTQHPVGRVGRPEDIAALVVYLASEEAGVCERLWRKINLIEPWYLSFHEP